ncbi:chaplin [Streptomyces piniterrae]|uniref:Chaplin n=1 Tax=Streptomyces piniterrae TaxID=2571125 RepID=A0A4V5MHU5_9ACTN|nr:chaplin family protein [Streptomyces piniterrae]TJZ42798.1 chaplin [Streptomyces piniterrae]
MRQSLSRSPRKCVLVAAAVLGILGVSGGPGYADTGAERGAAHSPGMPGGHSVRPPARGPVGSCGGTVDWAELLHPAMGDPCRNGPSRTQAGRHARDGRLPGAGWKADRRAAHSARAPRVGAVARAGASAGSALLASTGARQMGVAAGVGGGLVLVGTLLLRRARRS